MNTRTSTSRVRESNVRATQSLPSHNFPRKSEKGKTVTSTRHFIVLCPSIHQESVPLDYQWASFPALIQPLLASLRHYLCTPTPCSSHVGCCLYALFLLLLLRLTWLGLFFVIYRRRSRKWNLFCFSSRLPG